MSKSNKPVDGPRGDHKEPHAPPLPPHSVEAEMCLLGSVMLDKDMLGEIVQVVDREMFYQADHQILWDVVVELWHDGSKIDALIVREELLKRQLFDEVGGIAYIATILNAVPAAAHAPHYAKIVREKAVLRQLIAVGNDILRDAYAPHGQADAVLERAEQRIADARRSTGVRTTLGALVRAHPHLRPATIDGLIRRGDLLNIVGSSKSRKSWLVAGLAMSVAAGRKWLDTFDTERGRVLIIDNELHPSDIAHRLPMVGKAMGVDPDVSEQWIEAESLRGKTVDVHGLRSILGRYLPGELKLVIIDALYKIMPSGTNENDNTQLMRVYDTLIGYATRWDTSIALVHHSTKGDQSGKSVTDVGAGGGSQARATDNHLVLRAHEDSEVLVLDAAVRSFPPPARLCIRWQTPIFVPAPDANPEQLATFRNGRRRAAVQGGGDDAPSAELTPEQFVERFVIGFDDGRRDDVIERAKAAGVSGREATRLFRAAEDSKLIYEKKDERDRRHKRYSAYVPANN